MVRLIVAGICGLMLLGLPRVAHAGGSNSLMSLNLDGSRLVVANTDSGTVSVVDVPARKLLFETPVGDAPEGAAWVPGQALALVTVYGDDCVKFLNTSTGTIEFTLPVADEPYGVVVTADGALAYVSHDYPGSVSEIDIPGRRVTRTFAGTTPGTGCRGIALAADDSRLYISEFYTATLVALDRQSGQVSGRYMGHPQDNLARHVELHPTRAKAYLAHTRDRVTGFDARGSVFPHVSFCDLDKPAEPANRRSLALDTFNGVIAVTNPWETAVSPDGTRVYLIYASTNDANVAEMVPDDYQEIERIGRSRTVGRHPRAVRVSPDGKEVYVYATLDQAVHVFDATLTTKLGSIANVATPAHTAEWRRGKELFHTALDPMGSARWIACSSCHPDGLHDGRTWHNPEGLRKTPNLFGMAHTHPLHWSGDRDEAQDFEYTIRGVLMQGRGLAPRYDLKPRDSFTDFAESQQTTAGLSADLDALAVYQNSFAFRPSPYAAGPGRLTPEAERGRAIFLAAETRCATCHAGGYYTDSRRENPIRHDVGTGTGADEQIRSGYNTPTLLGVYRVNSYLHDGRAKSLEDVLTKHNSNDQHGKTSHLNPTEIAELVAFLKSLPFEEPPARTPNTVPHPVAVPAWKP